jgi:inner membrane protein
VDSVTQLVLGAACVAAVSRDTSTGRALLYGAVLGTLPDLDVLVPFADPVASYSYHRSFSHSLLLLLPFAALFAWLSRRLDKNISDSAGRWFAAVALALLTHPLLDAFTIYGTQLLWPVDRTPYGVGSVFIIDPAYTLPLLVVLIWAWWRPLARHRMTRGALMLSSAYLAWSVFAQAWVLERARERFAADLPADSQWLATPTPFNTLLWRVVARYPNGYAEAYYSLPAGAWVAPIQANLSADEQAARFSGHWPLERVQYFTHGFWALERDGDGWAITDLRMGGNGQYVFSFRIADAQGPIDAVQRPMLRPSPKLLPWLAGRLFSAGDGSPPPR